MKLQQQIDAFLAGAPHAVIGASRYRGKYGNKVLRVYLQRQMAVYPVNPTAEVVEGLTAYPNLASLPQSVHGLSVVTPPHVTEQVVAEAAGLGIRHIWMQPGSESDRAVELAQRAGMNVIWGGPCILVTLRFREEEPRTGDPLAPAGPQPS
jgi:predicted CoA-binding protein